MRGNKKLFSKMNLYISTSCLSNGKDIKKVLDVYRKAGIKNIELGSSHEYIEGIAKYLTIYRRKYKMNFVVHHYFPPPKNPLMINLASQNPIVLKRSTERIKNSIKFCSDLGVDLFSFHAGFRIDPDSRFRFDKNKPAVSYNEAFETFVKSLREIDNYAFKEGVKLAIENNVLSEYNLVNGKNRFLLMCEYKEFEQLFKEVPSNNLGIALDFGHLQVTSHWLKFDEYKFIEKVKEKIFVFQIHDNNHKVDTHSPLSETSWCLKVIRRRHFVETPVVLESISLSIEQIIQQLSLIENSIAHVL